MTPAGILTQDADTGEGRLWFHWTNPTAIKGDPSGTRDDSGPHSRSDIRFDLTLEPESIANLTAPRSESAAVLSETQLASFASAAGHGPIVLSSAAN